MGILNSINGKDKIYFNLIRLIRSDKVFSKEEKDTLTKYLNELKNGTQLNEFVDDEILCFIVTDMLDHKFKGTVKEYLEKNKDCLRFMFPQGTDTPDYDLIKKEVINNYLGKNGIFSNDLFDKTFYALFDEKIHYFQIMNIILSDEATKKYFDDIVEFAVTMGKEIDDYDLFYRELLGCVYAFNNVIDDRKSYLERRLKETRMSYGVYPGVTEETIAKMSRELEKTRMIIDQFEAIKRQIGAFKREIDDKVSYGKDELDKSIDKSKQSIEDCLYGYLDNMQDSINKRADAAVDGVIEESRNRLKEIRITADSIAKEVTSQLLKLHSESDALKSFVSSSEEFKEVVKIANANQELITGVLSLPSSEELAALKNAQVVPATSVVSPVVISNDQDEDNFLVPKFEMCDIILPAFDKKVQFEKRLKQLDDTLKELEAEGYIIPDALREALPWYILGGKMIYFYGPTQSGKTTLVELLAKAVGSRLIDGGKITEEYSITSYNDVRGKFDENPLFYALYNGMTVFYDEIDIGNPNNIVLLGTYASKLFEKISKPEKDVVVQFAKRRFVPINPNARIVTAGNTNGKGRSREYSSRNRFDESTQERIVPIYVGYDNTVEEKILGKYKEWFKFFNDFREQCSNYAIDAQLENTEGNLTTGDAKTIRDILDQNAMGPSSIIRGLFTQTKEDEYLRYLAANIAENYKISQKDIADDVIIHNIYSNKAKKASELKAEEIAKIFVYEASLSKKLVHNPARGR